MKGPLLLRDLCVFAVNLTPHTVQADNEFTAKTPALVQESSPNDGHDDLNDAKDGRFDLLYALATTRSLAARQ